MTLDFGRLAPLGELFTERGERSTDTSTATVYVAMDHLDPGSSRIERFGSASEAISTKSVFRSGDVLFGKLRPYLRKAALADRDGVCSTELLVLTPRPGLDGRFLLALLRSEPVVRAVITASAGTRMPRVSVRDLSSINVRVPPLAEQRRIVDLLASVDVAIDKAATAAAHAEMLRRTLIIDQLFPDEPWPKATLAEVTQQRREWITLDDAETYRRVRVRLHARGLVLRDEVIGSQIKTKRQQVCREGDFVVAKIDAKHGGYGVVPVELDQAVASADYLIYRTTARLSSAYLALCLETTAFGSQVSPRGTTNHARVQGADVAEYLIPLPPLDQQHEIVEIAGVATQGRDQVNEHVARLTNLRAGLLDDLLSGRHSIPESYDALLNEEVERTNLRKVA